MMALCALCQCDVCLVGVLLPLEGWRPLGGGVKPLGGVARPSEDGRPGVSRGADQRRPADGFVQVSNYRLLWRHAGPLG